MTDETSPTGNASKQRPEKKPWPISRVVVAIAVFVVAYTFVMIFFRKEEPPFYPYEEAQTQALGNLLSAENWTPMPEAYVIAEFRMTPEAMGFGSRSLSRFSAEETIGFDIGEHSTTPLVPEGVLAPETLEAGAPYQAEIEWQEKEEKAYPHRLDFYKRGSEILIFPPYGRITPEESAEPTTRILVPPEQLSPGEYTFYLYTHSGLQGWTLVVRE